MDVASIFSIGILCFLSGAVVSQLPLPKVRNFSYLFPAAGALLFLSAGLDLLAGPAFAAAAVPVSSVFHFSFRGDQLSGFFVVLISLITAAISLYSIGFTRGIKNAGFMGFFYNILVLSMYGVVLSADIFTFLVSWETMAVSSYFLVVFERNEETAKAGLFTVVMTHIGTAFIIALFLILSHYTGSMEFPAMRDAAAALPQNIKSLIFIFAIIGFGTKAGIIPLHAWIPRAYPVAPSNITPLMSGVMIKTAVYGFLRICLDVLGAGPEWWGTLVIATGAVSAVLGILYAIMENDLKVFLAYSSVENVGIILLGIGAAMIFRSSGMQALSGFALAAALYHTLNHAFFKGLLFLGAGSVVSATRTRNMEKLGGLLKLMPYTGFFFLLGALAITALPPLNGFISEWLTYQSLLLGFQSPSVVAKIVSPLGGAALALTGAVVAAGFVKTFGATFLGRARSEHATAARETSAWMVLGMALLALFCVLSGLFPYIPLSLISPVVSSLTGSSYEPPLQGFLAAPGVAASLSPAALAMTMLIIFLAALVFVRLAGGRRKTVYADSWDCGIPGLTPRMQYTATAFTKPLRIIYKRIYLPSRDLKVSYLLKPFFVKSIRYGGEITPLFERYVYEPVTRTVHAVAGRVKLLQSGSLQLYLGYILLTLILLLIFGT
ncbi:MAG TPA: hydrogenase 4 subunit B [Nitrospirota bacterium]